MFTPSHGRSAGPDDTTRNSGRIRGAARRTATTGYGSLGESASFSARLPWSRR